MGASVLQGHAGAAEQLLDAGASLDTLTEEGMTPLHCTVHLRNCAQSKEAVAGAKEVMQLLIKRCVAHHPFALPHSPSLPPALP